MRKMVFLMMLLLLGSIVLGNSIEADEDGYSFNGYEFDYYQSIIGSHVYLQLIVDCDYPEGVPHKYEPWPELFPGSYEYYESILIRGPNNFTLFGNIVSNIFLLDVGFIEPGLYQFIATDINSTGVFYHNFTMDYDYLVNLDSANWASSYYTTSPSHQNSVDENKVANIDGVQFTLNLQNIGDIPFGIGSPSSGKMSVYYQFNLSKTGDDAILYSSELRELGRPENLFSGQNTEEKYYFKPNESMECEETVANDSIDLSGQGAGTYSIEGYVKFGDYTYEFSLPNALTISQESGIPGFEIVLVLIAISFIVFLKRHR